MADGFVVKEGCLIMKKKLTNTFNVVADKRVGNITRPSKLKLIFLTLLSLLYSNKERIIFYKVGDYRLHKEIVKENGNSMYFCGIYKREGKMYFIKTWNGRIQDFNYQLLINELTINRILWGKLLEGKFRTPKIIEYIPSENSLSVVYEYIKGRSLLSYPISKQTKVISHIIEYFKEVSIKSENKKYLEKLQKKDKLFYLNSFTFLTILSLLTFTRHASLIIRGYYKALKDLVNMNMDGLIINHCDLNPDNILIHNGRYYILDCGRLSLTIPEYDLTYVSLNPAYTVLSKEISNQLGIRNNQFLKIYLSIQNLKLQDPKSGNYNFLNNLREAI